MTLRNSARSFGWRVGVASSILRAEPFTTFPLDVWRTGPTFSRALERVKPSVSVAVPDGKSKDRNTNYHFFSFCLLSRVLAGDVKRVHVESRRALRSLWIPEKVNVLSRNQEAEFKMRSGSQK